MVVLVKNTRRDKSSLRRIETIMSRTCLAPADPISDDRYRGFVARPLRYSTRRCKLVCLIVTISVGHEPAMLESHVILLALSKLIEPQARRPLTFPFPISTKTNCSCDLKD